jgi:flagellar biosynthetic protein FlhB
VAEEQDDSQKTEEPTQKRLDESRQKGQVASSKEINHCFMILGGALFVIMLAPGTLRSIEGSLVRFIADPHEMSVDGAGLTGVLRGTLSDVALALLMPLGLLLLLALFSGFVQHGALFSAEQLMPKLDKISPMAGFKRLFSMKSMVEFIKGLLKLVVVGTVLTLVVMPELSHITALPGYSAPDLLRFISGLSGKVLIAALAVVAVIAGLDMFYQRFAHMKSMRMTKQEVRDEMKQTDGDPMIKSRLRQLRMERARRRMMAEVPKATVVVTNPTHYAVALRYVAGEMEAPILVAKGADLVAARIREVAQENEIPIVENPPLARALFATVDLDQSIPAEHYRAVAEIIGYVMKLKQVVRGRA